MQKPVCIIAGVGSGNGLAFCRKFVQSGYRVAIPARDFGSMQEYAAGNEAIADTFPKLGGYLIISRQEKDGEDFKLWLWSGNASHAPRRVNVDGNYDLSKAEGIAPIRHNGIERIMIAFDAGHKSKRNKGCYLFLSYDQLKVSTISD